MSKPRPQVPPLLNGYAAAVNSSQLKQRRQQLDTSRSSGATPCSNIGAVPLAQVNTSMRRSSAAANGTAYMMDRKNLNLSNGGVFNSPPYPTSTVVQLPHNGDSESSQINLREYPFSPVHAQFSNCQPSSNMSDACSSASFQVGMKEVPSWLKALRLHKYTQLFQQMSYSEMMSMDDQQLEQRQVTKGARKKILQSIQKLRERVSLLKQLETCIDENGDTRCLIFELRAMMSTPIWTTNDENQEDLPHHICRILQRLHNHLFEGSGGLPPTPTNSSMPHSPLTQNVSPELTGLEDEYVVKLIQTYDRVVNHEAFTPVQKQLIGQQRRLLRLYAQQQYIQYSNVQSRNFSSTANHQANNKTASNARTDWMIQPPYRSPAQHSSVSDHHQHRHSLIHTPNQECPPPPPPIYSVGMAGLKANSRSNTNHSRFAGLEGAEIGSKVTDMEHRNKLYAAKVDVQPSQHIHNQFWPVEHLQRAPPKMVQAMAAGVKPPPHDCFSQQPSVKSWSERTANGYVAENVSSLGCWTDLGEKKKIKEQGWSDVGGKEEEQGSNQLSYPQLLLSMLSSMPEFRELLEKSIYSKNNKKAAMQTAATQTGHEPRFQETPLNNSTATDRPLTAEEKLQFVNEFFLQSSPEKEMQASSSSWCRPPYSEILAKQLANLQLARQQQEVKSKPVMADTFASSFDAWTPLDTNTIPSEPIRELVQRVQVPLHSSSTLSQPSLSLSNISSGYSSSTCSETERASSPGLMVYNFNDCSKCCSKLCESEVPSICPSFEKCTKETMVKEDPLSALAQRSKNCDSTDSAIGWCQQLSPSASFNCASQKTEVEQQSFAYTSPPAAIFFSHVGHNQYPVNETIDWRRHTNNPIYEQTMWYDGSTHRSRKHSLSSLHQNNNPTTQQQLSTTAHLWSAAPEMRAVH